MILNWRDASPNTVEFCIGEMHLSIHSTVQFCIAFFNKLDYYIGGMHLVLEFCIEGMHTSIHYTFVLEGCISQYKV